MRKRIIKFGRNRCTDFLIFKEKLSQLKKPFKEIKTKSRNLKLEYDTEDKTGELEAKELQKKYGIKPKSPYAYLTECFEDG